MVKLDLSGINISIEIVTSRGSQVIEIMNGRYKNNSFDYMVVTDKVLVLEGEKRIIVPFDVIYLKVETIYEKLSNILGDEIYTEGIAAIPEGKERELLEKLIIITRSPESRLK
ncbi:MAG: hypothetical protein NTY95_18710 [Bacteroidia bacterium]|nr:hypothetical protein [Bacteroidia bacterium]